MEPMHTFGGSALDRLIYDFEVPDGGSAGGSGDAGAGTSQTAEPGGDAASSTAVTEPAPAWSPEDPTFLETVDTRAAEIVQAQLQPLLPLLQALASGDDAGANAAAAQFDWSQVDPFGDGFGQNLGQGVAQAVQQALAPVYQFMQQMQNGQATFAEQQQIEQGNQRVDQLIADDLTANGDVGEKAKGLIRPLAEAMFPQYAERYGSTPRAAEMAVQHAARTIRDLIAEASSTGGQQTVEHLNALAGARGELGGHGAAGQGLAESQDPHEITRRYAGRMRGAAAV